MFFWAARTLTVGSNALDTTFSGAFQDGGQNGGTGGGVRKVGTGTLTLSGASTHTGGIAVDAGTLRVTSPTGAGLGLGPVVLNVSAVLAFAQQGLGGSNNVINTAALFPMATAGSFSSTILLPPVG